MDTELKNKRLKAYRSASELTRDLYGNASLEDILFGLSEEFKFNTEIHLIFVHIIGDIILGFNPKSELKELLVHALPIVEKDAQKIELSTREFFIDLPEILSVHEKTEVVPQYIPMPPKEIAVKPIEILAAPLVPERQVIPSVPVPQPPEKPIPTSLPIAPKNFREKLELRPENMSPIKESGIVNDAPKPLTRDEVIKAIASKRTMASDIAMMKQSGGDNAVHGYEAYQKVKGGEENK